MHHNWSAQWQHLRLLFLLSLEKKKTKDDRNLQAAEIKGHCCELRNTRWTLLSWGEFVKPTTFTGFGWPNRSVTRPLSACVSAWGRSPNHIMALWWRHPPLVQTHHTEAVFWVTKLNILAGLFLVPSVSTVSALHVRACVCVCVSPHLFGDSPWLPAAFDPVSHLHTAPEVYQLRTAAGRRPLWLAASLPFMWLTAAQDTCRLLGPLEKTWIAAGAGWFTDLLPNWNL